MPQTKKKSKLKVAGQFKPCSHYRINPPTEDQVKWAVDCWIQRGRAWQTLVPVCGCSRYMLHGDSCPQRLLVVRAVPWLRWLTQLHVAAGANSAPCSIRVHLSTPFNQLAYHTVHYALGDALRITNASHQRPPLL